MPAPHRVMNIWTTVYRCAWGALIVLLVVAMVSMFIPKFRVLQEYRARRQELREENRLAEARLAELKSRQEKFATDPEFVEKTAREAGMVRPNEVVVKFTNALPRSVSTHFPGVP